MTHAPQFRLYLEENGFDISRMGTGESEDLSSYSNEDLKAKV